MIKKSVFVLAILFLLPIISAVEFDMKTEFNQGETLMARVSGNFLEPILKENIFFYRGHVRISINPNVAKIDDEFYIYAPLLGKAQNNYSIVIKNVRYMKGSQISEDEIVKNFSIIQDIADFTIEPGFVVTKDDFFIRVQNLQESKITIQIKTTLAFESDEGFFSSLLENPNQEENSITLKSGEIKKINFKIEEITYPVLKTIELSTENLKYTILVYIFPKETEPEEKQRNFKFEPSELNILMTTNSNTTRIIYLYNTGKETLENISLSLSNQLKPYVSLSIKEINELKENSSTKIELILSSDYEEKFIEGQITAKAIDIYAYSAIFLNFLNDYTPINGEEKISIAKTCSEIKGKICDLKKEECDGESVNAKDSVCCLGNCKEIIKESSTGKTIGWAIIIIIISFLVWFFKTKYRGAKKPFNLSNIISRRK